MPPRVDPTKVPAAKPPPGQKPDYNSPENQATLYITISSILIALTTLFVVLKLYMRLFVQRNPGWDDACTVLALIGQIGYTAVVDWNMVHGAGRHMYDVRLSTFLKEIALAHDIAIVQQPTLLFTKLALLGLFYRLFSPKKPVKYAILAGMAFVTIFYTIMLFLFIFIKAPTATILVNKVLGIVNLATDIYILILPMIAISSLHMSLRRKIGVAAVFASGLLACAMSIISIVYRFQVTTTTTDLTWDFVHKFIVLTVEIDVGIMCGCMPVFPALIHGSKIGPWWTSTYKSIHSRLLRPSSSSKTTKGSTSGYQSNGARTKMENYHELQENRSQRKLVDHEVKSKGGLLDHSMS